MIITQIGIIIFELKRRTGFDSSSPMWVFLGLLTDNVIIINPVLQRGTEIENSFLCIVIG